MPKQKFKKVKAWVKGMSLVEKIYLVTGKYPKHEVYGLVSQMRRAAVSIVLNISEGSGSGSDLDYKRYLEISLKSSYELACALEISLALKYIQNHEYQKLLKELDEISAMLFVLVRKIKFSLESKNKTFGLKKK